MRYRQVSRLALLLLLTSVLSPLLIGLEVAYAAPTFQGDPVAQCAEGVQLFSDKKFTQALPLLAAGFAGRERATFANLDVLGLCALFLGRLHADTGDPHRALEVYSVALEIVRRSGNRELEGTTLNNIGTVCDNQGRYVEALKSYQLALTIRRETGDQKGEGTTLNNIGLVYRHQGRYAEALKHYQLALAIIREAGNRADESTILNNIGEVYRHQGRYVEALEHSQLALEIAREVADPAGVGHALNNIGMVYDNQGRYQEALENYQPALAIRREIGDRPHEGATLNNIGEVYHHQGRYVEALEHYQLALMIAHKVGDAAGAGTTLNNVGGVYNNQGRYAEALKSYRLALAICQEIGDRAGEGMTLNNIGIVYDNQGRYAEALENYRLALAIWQEVGDRAGEGTTLNNIGTVYRHQGHYANALENYQLALAILQKVGDRAGEGLTLNNIGGIYHSQGRYQEVLERYQLALAIAREVGNRAGESTTLNNMGLLYDNQGRYQEALESYQLALAILQKVGDQAGEGTTLSNIGKVYHSQGRYAEALKSYQQALAIRRKVGDQAGVGLTLNNIGGVYHSQGDSQEALESYQLALAILQKVGDRAGEGATLNNIAGIYRKQGRYAEALESYQLVLTIRREVGDRAGEGATLNNIGGVYHHQGRYVEALESYQQALAITREVGDRPGEGTILDNIGFSYEQQGDRDEALAYYTQAMDVREAVRAVAGSEQGRAEFIAQHADLYERAVLLYHQKGRDDLAFQTSERGRARAFLDSLATGYVQLSDQESAALWTQEQETYTARQAAQDALTSARAANPPDAALVTALEKQLKDATTQYDAALVAIEQGNSRLTELIPGRTSGALDVTEVQKLLAPQTTLVSFFVGTEQTLAFILTQQRFQTVVLPIGQAALHDQIQALLNNPAFQQETQAPEAGTLYAVLSAPLKPYIPTRHLAIIPHGDLHYLPWAALGDGGSHLIDKYVLSVLPSASVLPFIQANSGHSLTAPLVVGNPDGTLRFAGQEARAVANLYGVQPLIGDKATKDALQKRVSAAGIVHLATHATFDSHVPLASSITLAPSPTSTVRLEASEIYSLDLGRAGLVVLSACQTNLGEVSAGDEVVGLTRAFFFAGTPTVVSSLWSVDDAATGLLMERFYTYLQAGVGKAEALQQAQKDVRARYPAPHYWAGFVLAGDAGAVSLEPRWLAIIVSGVLALGMLGAAGMLLRLHRRLVHEV